MDAVTDPALHHLPVSLRNLPASAYQQPHPTLTSQLGHDFDSAAFQSYPTIEEIPRGNVNGRHFSSSNGVFVHPQTPGRLHGQQVSDQRQTPNHPQSYHNTTPRNVTFDTGNGARYPILSPEQQYSSPSHVNLYSPARPIHQRESSPTGLQAQNGSPANQNGGGNKDDGVGGGHFSGMKLIRDPPNLELWRERLFNVEDTITLTEEEFQTYFPHVDNVYSHRSTQKYKRKPFVSHYWDCRLKGRPPGTPKSSDPSKKKRRRTARERDLCDVKIKITEYFPGAGAVMAQPDVGSNIDPARGADTNTSMNFVMESREGAGQSGNKRSQPFGVLAPSSTLPAGHPGANGAKYYTIQRVSGNPGGENSDAIGAMHKHTLEESDRVKKNSVQRWLLKEEKALKRRDLVCVSLLLESFSLASPLASCICVYSI